MWDISRYFVSCDYCQHLPCNQWLSLWGAVPLNVQDTLQIIWFMTILKVLEATSRVHLSDHFTSQLGELEPAPWHHGLMICLMEKLLPVPHFFFFCGRHFSCPTKSLTCHMTWVRIWTLTFIHRFCSQGLY